MSKNKHSVEHIKTQLQIDEHMSMQERGWKVQAVGLYFIFALVLTAAVGLYGDGLISARKITNGHVTVEYQRQYRFQARMEIKVQLQNSTDGAMVSFPTAYLKKFEVASIVPQPNENKFQDDRVHYLFKGSDGMSITFYLIPQHVGNINGSIQVNNKEFDINHFIFP
ncbi:hypothetical protein [Chryseolinea sp. H1M3-3]|uniref:hypothetical protein n=1 Tax=Chryseolinea sp. H1M3-3 TaxID=3034144 RepID=UPI0023EB29E2|nr:hypothetical protein [Chryseolinea sp. H1M3-3]